MSYKPIAQREARRLRKRVEELEHVISAQRRRYSQEFVGGVQITSAKWDNGDNPVPVAIRTARTLRHAVVAVGDDSGLIRFMALPLPESQ